MFMRMMKQSSKNASEFKEINDLIAALLKKSVQLNEEASRDTAGFQSLAYQKYSIIHLLYISLSSKYSELKEYESKPTDDAIIAKYSLVNSLLEILEEVINDARKMKTLYEPRNRNQEIGTAVSYVGSMAATTAAISAAGCATGGAVFLGCLIGGLVHTGIQKGTDNKDAFFYIQKYNDDRKKAEETGVKNSIKDEKTTIADETGITPESVKIIFNLKNKLSQLGALLNIKVNAIRRVEQLNAPLSINVSPVPEEDDSVESPCSLP